MKTKLFFFSVFFLSLKIFAQSEFVIGNISDENGTKLTGASIFNLRTEQVVVSDKMGNFVIAAKPSDELRIARQGYERKNIIVNNDNFSKNLEIKLMILPQEIEEVKIAFQPTGILKKDVTRLNPPSKIVELNNNMNLYMRTPPTEAEPKATVPSAFRQHDFSEGQVSILALVGAAVGLVKKAAESPKTTATYAETQEFYNRIKSVIDMDYYAKFGMDEYDFDIFLAYADKAYDLSKNYRKNFNKVAIEMQLKTAFVKYIKTHSFIGKKSEG